MDMQAVMRWVVALVVSVFLAGMPGPQAAAKEPSPPRSRGEVKAPPAGALPATVTIVKKWDGDFPVAALKKLPRGQQKTPAGYIGDKAAFAEV